MANYKVDISESAASFINELKSAVRSGLYAWTPNKNSVLLQLPALMEEPDDFITKRSKLIELIEYTVRKKLRGIDAVAGAALFGIDDYAGMPLSDRHRVAVKLYDPYWTWENYRREPYIRFLLSVHNFLISQKLPMSLVKETMPKPANMGLIGEDWEMVEFDASYNLPDKNNELIAIIKYRLICKAESADTLRCRVRWRQCGSSEAPTITLLSNGDIDTSDNAFDELSGLQTFICKVTLPHTMQYQEEATVEMLRRMPVLKESFYSKGRYDWYGITQMQSSDCKVRLTINFSEHCTPKHVWRRESLFNGLVRKDGLEEKTRLPIKKGRTTYEWQDTIARKSYGISIIW